MRSRLFTVPVPGGLGRGKIKVLQSFELRLGLIRMG